MDKHQQHKKQRVLAKMWRKRNPLALLAGMQTGAAILGNSMEFPLKVKNRDTWVAQLVKYLPLAQVMIPGSWDGVPHWAPCSVRSLLLPLPATPPACALSLCQINF